MSRKKSTMTSTQSSMLNGKEKMPLLRTSSSTLSTTVKYGKPLFTRGLSDSVVQTPTSSTLEEDSACPSKSPVFFTKKLRNAVYNPRPWQSSKDEGGKHAVNVNKRGNSSRQSGQATGSTAPKRGVSPPSTVSSATMCINKASTSSSSLLLQSSKAVQLSATAFSSRDSHCVKTELYQQTQTVQRTSVCNIENGDVEDVSEETESVRTVKAARECQERGEIQNFLDDIQYIIDGLKVSLPVNARALSTHTLITKCLSWDMRRKFRNRRVLSWILHHLRDAEEHTMLAFSAAIFLYTLLRNTNVLYLDQACLKAIFQLMRYDSGSLCPPSRHSIPSISTNASSTGDVLDGDRIRLKFLQTLEDFHKEMEKAVPKEFSATLYKHLRLSKLVKVPELMLELVLNLNHRKSSSLFKNDIRIHGALDVIADAVIAAADYIGDDLGPQNLDEFVLDRVKRLIHYLRLLEDVTYRNRENQLFLASYKERVFLDALVRCLRLCVNNVPHNAEDSEPRKLLVECLTGVLGLFLNISCDNEYTSDRLGACPYLLDLTMHVTLRLASKYVAEDVRTDVLVISLGLMVNLAEHSFENRARIMHLQVSPSDEFESNEVADVPDSNSSAFLPTISPSPIVRRTQVPAINELVELFTKMERDIQEHEFEKNDASINENAEPETSATITTPPPLKFHLIEGGKGRSGVSETADGSGDPDNSSGADVEFEVNSAEERERLKKTLDRAEVHMKHSMVCAYLALLLGCLLQNNARYSERIRQLLPDRNFRLLAYMLAKLHQFLQLTQAIGEEEQKSVERIVRVLEEQDGITYHSSEGHS